MASESPTTSHPVVRTHIESHAEQSMPPVWASRPVKLEGVRTPTNGVQGVWFAEGSGALRARLVDVVNSAKEVLCVSSFIMADELLRRSLLAAASVGVRVYVLTATEQKLMKGPVRDDEFSERVLEDHVHLLDALTLRTLLRSGDDLHAKYVIADPNTSGAHGIIFTCNLTAEGLTRNPEIAVEVRGDAARDLFRMFLFGFWKQSKRELLEPGKISANRPFLPVDLPVPRVLPCTHEGSTELKAELRRLVNGSTQELWVASWKFDPTHSSVQDLREAALRGVQVRLLTSVRPSPDHMEALVNLVKAGVQVRGFRFLHAKAVISDQAGGPTGLVMSANFDPHGLDSGYEVGIRLTGSQLDAVRSILAWWWETASHSLEVDKKLGDLPSCALTGHLTG